jgi:ribosomal protein S12 methylthiotransferase
MAERSNICKYLDIPVQHHSDRMLKIMRRGITSRRSEELLTRIREQVPGIALRTTLLLGHPGETEADIDVLCSFVEHFKFDRLGVFTYSHEENTYAHTLPDDVPAEVKEARASRIMEIQQEISDAANAALLGKELKVLIDRIEGEHYVGRTEFDSPEVDNEVFIPTAGGYLRVGDFAQVRITSHTPYDLFGDIA